MSLASESDERLMVRYQAGENPAFAELYRRHSGRVYGYLRKRLGRAEEADEVFQKAFAKLHRSRDRYDPKFGFQPWLFAVTRGVLLDHWKGEGRRIDSPRALAAEETRAYLDAPAREAAPDRANEPRERADTLSELESLPEAQRRALEWRVLDEATYAEIASRLARSEDNVRQMVSRGLRKLRLARMGREGAK